MSEPKKQKDEAALQRKGGAFVALANRTETVDLLMENFGGDADLSPWDLQRIRIPAGGSQAWTLPSLDGGVVSTPAIECVVLVQRPGRALWRSATPDNRPPDCSSTDGRVGVGDPGGNCAACPYNQWGSDPKGGPGKACKELRQLFMLRPEDRLPALLTLPPTSLKPWRQYKWQLTNAGLVYYGVLNKFGLRQRPNKAGQLVSVIDPSMLRKFNEDEMAGIRELRAAIQPMLARVQITEEDYPTDDAS